MLELSQIKLPCGSEPGMLGDKIHKMLHLSAGISCSYEIRHHSVDARKKPVLYDVYTVWLRFGSSQYENRILQKCSKKVPNLRKVSEVTYHFPVPEENAKALLSRPVIIGFGPAGIFCGLKLAEAGYRPIILERGERMEERILSVEHFWQTGELNPSSNIQFGEGGAGTFSDGKLTSNVKDKEGRVSEVIRLFLEAGAPADIAYEQLPHIGTDRLRSVIRTLREEILAKGGEIRFQTCAEEILLEDGCVKGVRVKDADKRESVIPAKVVVLAPGHSARDTIRMLHDKKVPMEAKSFALGFRVSHPQSLINQVRYGIEDPEERKRLHLPSASYKLTARAEDGHGVYSFCMCPGGYVVNASSEKGRLAVNGMSDYARDAARANSAIVMTIGPEDYGTSSVLDGMTFQEELEEKAYRLAGGKVPVEYYPQFRDCVRETAPVENGTGSTAPSPAARPVVSDASETDTKAFAPDAEVSAKELCIKGACALAPLHTLLPQDLTKDFVEGMTQFGRQIRGFDGNDCYVIGLESRTSSPVRIPRDASGESAVKGLYPCGEGAGYAGGIMSAAVDGIRIAEQIGIHYVAV